LLYHVLKVVPVYRMKPVVSVIALVLFAPAISFAQAGVMSAPLASRATADLRIGAARAPDAAPMPAMPGAIPNAKDYRVGPGDLLEVDILDAEGLKRTVRVNAAGAISLPLVGQVQVAGLSSQELEERIAARYAEKYLQNPQVSIFIKEFTTERITVEGAVGKPGIFPLTGQMTLLRVLAVAGGFAHIANTSEVMLYRVNDSKVREVAVFDVEKIRAGKAEDPAIRGDDLIVVQRDSTRALLRDSLLRDVVDSINPFSFIVPR
jgi:polysaccharide export outer membrane protein